MKKALLSIIFVLTIFAQCYCSNVLPIIETTRFYRINAPINEQDKQSLLKSLKDNLPNYNGEESLQSAIDEFLQDQFNDRLPTYHIVSIAGTEISGNSPDPVFFVMDENNTLVFVVKAFMHPTERKCNFVREISSLDFLKSNPKIGINTPSPLGVGQTTVKGTHYGLLAQSLAQGERLDSFIKCLKDAQDDDYAKKYQQLREVFKVSAESIARLNAEGTVKGRISSRMIEKLRKKVAMISQEPTLIADSVALEDLKRFVNDLIQRVAQRDFVKGYSHFSAHMANVFYSPEAKQISYIDVAKMFESYAYDGKPLSFSAYDVVRYIHSFSKVAVPFMEFEVMQQLAEEFMQQYFAASNDTHAPELIQFLEVDSMLGRILKYADYAKIHDPVKREHNRKVFEMSKQLLRIEMQRGRVHKGIVFGMVVDPKTGIATCQDVSRD